jgi:glycosyltransferase involved in cell wall biosynthesis
MEAFALGRPVIASAIAGIPELVEPGRTGWLVPPGSVDALAAAVREVFETDTAVLERMGREGRRRVMNRFRSKAAAARLMELFQTGEFR